jgi:ABC-type nitrate/sulfonate/bicarbonate transport system ATPase subunit
VDIALSVEHVTKRFGVGDAAIIAVEDMSFDVAEGEFVSLIGPSGCGKSTLFHIIGGLTGEHAGRVAVAGETITGPHPAIGMVFQEESTFPWRSVISTLRSHSNCVACPERNGWSARGITWRWSVCRASSVAIRRNCRAGCASALPSLARLPRSRASC